MLSALVLTTAGYTQTLDTAFNPGANGEIFALAIQPDGKILVGGNFTMLGGAGTGTTTRNYIGRLNADGSLDTTFNPGANGSVNALAVQADGKILVGGSFTGLVGSFDAGFMPRNYLGRLNPNGSLDTTFNPDADYYWTNFGGPVEKIVLQSDGKILVGGDGLFTRLSYGGVWDNSFNRRPNGYVLGIGIRPNDAAVFGGSFIYLDSYGTPSKSIAWLNSDGSLNSAATGDGANDRVTAIAVQPDGKVVVGGEFTTLGFGGGLVGSASRPLIGRLNANGSLDSTFVPGPTSTNGFRPWALAVQPDGKILVGGYFWGLGGGSGATNRDYLGRLNTNGSLDTSFNPGVNGSVNAMLLQADGKILVGGDFTRLGGGGSGNTTRNNIGRFLGDSAVPGAGLIYSFVANPLLVNPGQGSTLSWSAAAGASLTLNGTDPLFHASGSVLVVPSSVSSYTLTATNGTGSSTSTVTVTRNDGTAALDVPAVTLPGNGQTVVVTGVGFSWTGVGGATGYDLRVFDAVTGTPRFSGSLLGAGSTSTLISLPAGSFRFAVRACSGGFSGSQCGRFGTSSFIVSPAGPSDAPSVTFPTQGTTLTASTQTFSWTAVNPNPALSGPSYEVLLRDMATGATVLQITVPSPNLSTVFTLKSSNQYELKVRACQAGCGPYSTPVTFAVSLPPVPTVPPNINGCSVTSGNSLTCNWNPVSNADTYQVQVVQPPPAGPGGGALTAAARQVSTTTVMLPVPSGAATVFVAACNGNGCGPNATVAISAATNPSVPNLGTPMAGTVVSGPGVLFTWNRVPGDNGSNTPYRLFVQDLSRQSTALDVFTTNNFYSALFKAEGSRYDALVISNVGQPGQATGPSQGFNVSGSSATAPTLVSPTHNGSITAGNIQLGWSPVPGATLYEYFVAVLGQSNASARGVTTGLFVQVPLSGTGAGTQYSGIVRACPAGATCISGSDAAWGPWSNAPGGPGVTNFTVKP